MTTTLQALCKSPGSSDKMHIVTCFLFISVKRARTLYQNQEELILKKSTVIGQYNVGNCFGASFAIIVFDKMTSWCNILRLGTNDYTKLGLYLSSNTTTLVIRTSTVCILRIFSEIVFVVHIFRLKTQM